MNGGFDNLRPEVHADEAIRHIHRLTRIAMLNLESFHEEIRELGNSKTKVYFILLLQGGPLSAVEIHRISDVPLSSVKFGLSQLRERGWAFSEDGMWNLTPERRRTGF